MKTIKTGEVSVPELHHLLLGSIGPRPIAFASTVDAEGNPNLAPFSFFNVFSANPPILIFSPARSGRTNTTKDTYNNVKAVGEVVINVVTQDIVHQMSLASSPYDAQINEFEKSGLTAIPSEYIRPFRVKESPVQMECKVNEVIELGMDGGAGNLVICEMLCMHIREEILHDNLKIDQEKIGLVARMGGNWYCHANPQSMFEISKPITTKGMGIDQIPADIRNSHVLSGNDLGQLGNVEILPDETEVNEHKLLELSEIFIAYENDAHQLEKELHLLAKEHLSDGKVLDAWKTLLAYNNQ